MRADNPGDAFVRAKQALAKLRAAALSAGITETDLATTTVSLHPSYNSKGEPNGHEASFGLAITVRQMDAAGDVISAVTKAAGVSARLNGVRLEHSDPSHLITEARELAVADARAKAEQLAALVGGSLGECVAITEGGGPSPRPMMMRSMAFADSGGSESFSIDPGQVKVSVTVHTAWKLSQRGQ